MLTRARRLLMFNSYEKLIIFSRAFSSHEIRFSYVISLYAPTPPYAFDLSAFNTTGAIGPETPKTLRAIARGACCQSGISDAKVVGLFFSRSVRWDEIRRTTSCFPSQPIHWGTPPSTPLPIRHRFFILLAILKGLKPNALPLVGLHSPRPCYASS